MQVILSAKDLSKTSRLFQGIACSYPARLLAFADLGADLPRNAIVVADFLAATPRQMHDLKALTVLPGVAVVGLVDFGNRQQLMQVREIGFHDLIDKSGPFMAALMKLRNRLGTYSTPRLDASVSPATTKAIMQTCAALDDTAVSALGGGALPYQKLEESSRAIISAIQTDGIDAWLSAVQQHHSHTFCHSMMVTGHTVLLARALDLPEEEQSLLGLSALVHDLGKIRIPLSILDKPGKLTAAEQTLVRRHPQFSRDILQTCEGLSPAVYDIAVRHHEFLDGSGYPDGLSGEAISRPVRIVTICDIYSALTERRAYKDSYSPRQAFVILAEMGDKLDRPLLRRFRDVVLQTGLGDLRRAAV